MVLLQENNELQVWSTQRKQAKWSSVWLIINLSSRCHPAVNQLREKVSVNTEQLRFPLGASIRLVVESKVDCIYYGGTKEICPSAAGVASLLGSNFTSCFIANCDYKLWSVKSYFYIFSLSYSFYGVLWKESRHLQCGWYPFKPVLLWIQDFRDMLPRSKGNALLRRLFEMEMTVD